MNSTLIKIRIAGVTLLELLLGTIIFTLAMLPMFSLTQSSTRGAYSISKHLIAGQIAANVLDRILAMPYAEARKYIEERKGKEVSLLDRTDNLVFSGVVDTLCRNLPPPEKGEIPFDENLNKSLKTFKYILDIKEGKGDEPKEMFLAVVKVTWNLEETNEKSRQEIVREAIKFNEDY